MVALFAVATATVLTAPKVQQQVVSFIDDGLKFIGETIENIIMENKLRWMLAFAALDNVMMSKKKGKFKRYGFFFKNSKRRRIKEKISRCSKSRKSKRGKTNPIATESFTLSKQTKKKWEET